MLTKDSWKHRWQTAKFQNIICVLNFRFKSISNHTHVMTSKLSLMHQPLRIPIHNNITHVLGEFSSYTYFNYVIIDSSLLLSNWYNQLSKLLHSIQTLQIYFNLLFPIFETQMQCHKAGGNTYRKKYFCFRETTSIWYIAQFKGFSYPTYIELYPWYAIYIVNNKSTLKQVHANTTNLKACKISNTNH